MTWSGTTNAELQRHEGKQMLTVSLYFAEWAQWLAEDIRTVFNALPDIDELMEHESSSGPGMPRKQPSTTCMSLLMLM